ncbi:MAG: NAD(P)H-hydrate epimerase [Actinomycetaceae bacterium]|nr:NAD(P)H-hydrate epimerase [Actinomycetaceae bacterium]
MIRTYATSMIREREYAIVHASPVDSLMKKAAEAVAKGAADSLESAAIPLEDAQVVALVGGGDNGGDALYACAFLQALGAKCACVLLTKSVHERACARAEKEGVDIVCPNLDQRPRAIALSVVKVCRDADVIIDGMLGTGGKGALRNPMLAVVRAVNKMFDQADQAAELSRACDRATLKSDGKASKNFRGRPLVVAIDLPSGIGGDDGAVAGEHLRADKTVTMGGRKPASLLPPACHSFGEHIDVVDLGLELDNPQVCQLEAYDVAQAIFVPSVDDHKYTRGVVQIVAGSGAYPMTGVMCVEAAARSGAGMVRFRGPEDAYLAVLSRIPEAVIQPGRYQAQLIGPGIAPTDRRRVSEAVELAKQSLASDIPLVLDAGALQLFTRIFPSGRVRNNRCVVVTPHAGEAAQLLSELGEGEGRGGISRAEVEEEPYRWAHTLAEITRSTVVLKGAATVIASPFAAHSFGDRIHGIAPESTASKGDGKARTSRSRASQYQTFVGKDAPGWTGTAGAGDVLAGIVTTLLAGAQAREEKLGKILNPGDAAYIAASAVWLHSIAARMACGMMPRVGGVTGDGFAEGATNNVSPMIGAAMSRIGHPIVASDIACHIPYAIEYALASALS